MAKKNDRGLLFDFLKAANRGDFGFLDRLSDEDLKEIQPFVVLGWLHGAKDNRDAHTILTDVYVNETLFTLHRHPRLVLQTMIAANSGIDNTRYEYVKSTSKKETSRVIAVANYYSVTTSEAKDYINILDKKEVDKIVEMMGYADE